MLKPALRLFLCCLTATTLTAQVSLQDKLSALRQTAKAHQRYIGELLDQSSPPPSSPYPPFPENDLIEEPDFQSLPLTPIESVEKTFPEPGIGLPTVPLPELDYENSSPAPVNESSARSTPPHFRPTPIPQSPYVDQSNRAEVSKAYENLYNSGPPERRIGYYFGPFFGFVFPDDSSSGGASYQANNGMLLGVRMGRDFGAIRVEGEYSYLSHDLEPSGDSKLHNFMSRFILENTIGEQADLRTGLGLGLTSVKTLADSNFGFSYDFLLGWSYRFTESWSLAFDYRYYLTAAGENLGRSQGHILECSANFDI